MCPNNIREKDVNSLLGEIYADLRTEWLCDVTRLWNTEEVNANVVLTISFLIMGQVIDCITREPKYDP